MRAKDFMCQLKKLDNMITNKLFEKEQWLSIAYNTTARTGGERVQSSGSQQKMADAVGMYIDMEAEINACIDKLVDTRRDIISVIENLNAIEYDLLHKVYVQDISLYEVAGMYGKTYSWATTIHGRALKHVQNILDKREGKEVCLNSERKLKNKKQVTE